MTETWEPKTRYFVILNKGQLIQVLGEFIEEKMKYKPIPKENGEPWMLEDVCRCCKELEGNKIAIDIQISNSKYIKERCVQSFITKDDFELAKQQFGVSEFLTKDEYLALESINVE